MNRHLPVAVAVVLLLCSAALPVSAQEDGTPVSRLRALKAERLAARPQAAAVAAAAKTVVVDCTKGSTISAALDKNIGPLVVEVRGTCKENLRIERSDLTLRGADPSTDGIQGVTATSQPIAAVELNYANRIVLENLFVSDSPSGGVATWWSELVMRNCRIERNLGTGVHISAASGLEGTELVVSNNGTVGINSQRVSWVTCTGCRLENNASTAATSRMGGFMTLWDTVVSGPGGIAAWDAGSYVDVDCVNVVSEYPCSINNTSGSVARAYGGGSTALWGVGAFTGLLTAPGGEVAVFGGQQTRPDNRANRINYFGRLTTGKAYDADGAQFGGPTRLAQTELDRFSHAVLDEQTELAENLVCRSGSDAWSDSAYPAAKVSSCANVPKAP